MAVFDFVASSLCVVAIYRVAPLRWAAGGNHGVGTVLVVWRIGAVLCSSFVGVCLLHAPIFKSTKSHDICSLLDAGRVGPSAMVDRISLGGYRLCTCRRCVVLCGALDRDLRFVLFIRAVVIRTGSVIVLQTKNPETLVHMGSRGHRMFTSCERNTYGRAFAVGQLTPSQYQPRYQIQSSPTACLAVVPNSIV